MKIFHLYKIALIKKIVQYENDRKPNQKYRRV